MKVVKLVAKSVLVLALVPVVAFAQWNATTQRYGNQAYTNAYGPNGQSINQTQQSYGNQTHMDQTYNDGQGNMQTQHCTSQRVGNQVYTNCY